MKNFHYTWWEIRIRPKPKLGREFIEQIAKASLEIRKIGIKAQQVTNALVQFGQIAFHIKQGLKE